MKINGYSELRHILLMERDSETTEKLVTLQKKRAGRLKKAEAITRFIRRLSERDEALTTFTDGLWLDSIDQVNVHPDGTLTFRFQDGNEVTM